MAQGKLKSRDELIKSGIRMYKNMQQYREKYLSGEITDDDIVYMAETWADKQIDIRSKRLIAAGEEKKDFIEEDLKHREKQRKAYRSTFDWNDANDEATLEQLLDLEVQVRQINRDIDSSKDYKVKNSHRNALTKAISEHRQLQKSLMIDRESRDKKRETTNVVEDWDRIKSDASKKIEALNKEFDEEAAKVKTEGELRDRLKYHAVIPFSMVDSILLNHRRVLGLDQTIEKS